MRTPCILAVVALAGPAALGCRDSATPPTAAVALPDNPTFTVASGFTGGQLVRANVGEFRTKDFGPFRIDLKSHDDADVDIISQVGVPGAHSGWHSHLRPVFVVIKSGSLTVYQADDPTCSGRVYPAGTTILEGTSTHIVRNEGSTNVEFVAVFFVPAGGTRRVDQPAPGNCTF